MTYKLAPSMMCCDILNIKEQMNAFKKQEVELLHIDIMDGSFVPNFALGTDFARQLKRATNIPLDLHFMTEQPEQTINWFPIGMGDYVSIHYETTKHLQRVLSAVKSKGASVLLAINPATPVEVADDVLDDIDGLLIMTVNPSYAGQKMIPHSIDKIARARKYLDSHGKSDAEIEVDGNVSIENAIRMRNAGANIFVAGSASVFCDGNVEKNVRDFKMAVYK